MITVTISGTRAPGQPKVSKILNDCLVGSRLVVRYFPAGTPSVPPVEDDNVIVIIDNEGKEKPA